MWEWEGETWGYGGTNSVHDAMVMRSMIEKNGLKRNGGGLNETEVSMGQERRFSFLFFRILLRAGGGTNETW